MDEMDFVRLLAPKYEEASQLLAGLMVNGLPDWQRLPRDLRYASSRALALIIDGYDLADRLIGAYLPADQSEEGADSIARARMVYDTVLARLHCGGMLPSALELWTALFFHQRAEGFTTRIGGDLDTDEPGDAICHALRAALVAGHLFPYARPPVIPTADSYGGVIVSSRGEVLLREVSGHFGGYVWTFAKGKPEADEEPEHTALREVREETGHSCTVIRPFPRAFAGTTGSTGVYLMASDGGAPERHADETVRTGWFGFRDAARRISMTTTSVGRARDRRILDSAHAILTVLGRPISE